ncbi:MAG: RDD family protein [Promethearchaeota archaeon]
MRYCPFCGAEVDNDSIYCLNCGKKLPERPVKGVPAWKTTPSEPSFAPRPVQPITYRPLFQPRPYHPAMKAPCGERAVGYLIDSAISGILSWFAIGFVYSCVKDGIREGQSLGKGLMRLRVVDIQTGMPATIGQSFIRNCCPGCLDGCCCYLVALIDQDGRRIGDHAAGTVVILDQ